MTRTVPFLFAIVFLLAVGLAVFGDANAQEFGAEVELLEGSLPMDEDRVVTGQLPDAERYQVIERIKTELNTGDNTPVPHDDYSADRTERSRVK